MKVLKFGGSSVANAENIQKVISVIRDACATDDCMVVLSAMQGTTDALIEAGRAAERGDDGFFERLARSRKGMTPRSKRSLKTGRIRRSRIMLNRQ